MKILGLSTLILLTLIAIPRAQAELDSGSQQALTQTQQQLTDPVKRQAAIANNRSAIAADQQVQSLSGGSKESTDAIYGLTANIMGTLTTDSGGDVTSMQKRLEDAAKNPEAFLNSLSADQKKSLEAIAAQIQAQRGPSNQH